MDVYTFNGFSLGGVTLEMSSIGILVRTAEAFRVLVLPKDPSGLSRVVPAKVVCSNLRAEDPDSGARNHVRGSGDVFEIVEQDDGLVILRGAFASFILR